MNTDEPSATETAAAAQRAPSNLDDAIHSTSAETLLAVVADPAFTEDLALALLKRADIPSGVLERLAKNSNISKFRKVKLALVTHPHTPRHISLPMVRQLYLFDLMQVALTPAVPADLKIAADEALVTRLETISLGEKLSLARRASARVAAALLLDKEARVMQAALENPRLTEASIVKTIMRSDTSAAFVQAVSRNPKWSLRQEVRLALLCNNKTPSSFALEFARSLPRPQLREILQKSRLPAHVKSAIQSELAVKSEK